MKPEIKEHLPDGWDLKGPYDVLCRNVISHCFHETTRAFSPFETTRGHMVTLKEPFKSRWRFTFPEYRGTFPPDMVCPKCDFPYAPGRFLLLRDPETGKLYEGRAHKPPPKVPGSLQGQVLEVWGVNLGGNGRNIEDHPGYEVTEVDLDMRNELIVDMKKETDPETGRKYSLIKIGKKFGISGEAVRKVLKKMEGKENAG